MPGNATGALKTAARRIGVSVEEYASRERNGERWCITHKRWEPRADFSRDRSRGDGLEKQCRLAKAQKNRRLKLKHRYGISIEDEARIWRAQHGRCSICCDHLEPARFDIDHDHLTGKARGLLCKPCNRLLGHAREQIRILEAAIAYLRAHNGK